MRYMKINGVTRILFEDLPTNGKKERGLEILFPIQWK